MKLRERSGVLQGKIWRAFLGLGLTQNPLKVKLINNKILFYFNLHLQSSIFPITILITLQPNIVYIPRLYCGIDFMAGKQHQLPYLGQYSKPQCYITFPLTRLFKVWQPCRAILAKQYLTYLQCLSFYSSRLQQQPMKIEYSIEKYNWTDIHGLYIIEKWRILGLVYPFSYLSGHFIDCHIHYISGKFGQIKTTMKGGQFIYIEVC